MPLITTDYNTHQKGTTMNGSSMLYADEQAREAINNMDAGSTEGMAVVLEAIATLQGRIESLEAQNKNFRGRLDALIVNCQELRINNEPLLSKGTGAPSYVPQFVGQMYMDTSTHTLYIAETVTNSTNDWHSTK